MKWLSSGTAENRFPDYSAGKQKRVPPSNSRNLVSLSFALWCTGDILPEAMRIVLRGLGALVLLSIPLVVGTFLLVISVLALLIGFLVRRYGYRHAWSPVLWWGFVVLATGVAIGFKLWPTPAPTASCSTSPLPVYGTLFPAAQYVTAEDTNARSRSQVDIYFESFDRRRFELLQSAEYSEEAFRRVQDGYRVLNSLAKIESGVDLGPLQNAISTLEDQLNRLSKPGESRLDAIRDRRGKLQTYLTEHSNRSKELEESAIQEFDKRFNEGLGNASLEAVHGAISALDSALTSAINKTFSGDLKKRINAVSLLSAELNEAASVVELRESIVIMIDNAEVTQIDASSLQIGSDVLRSRLSGAEQRFEILFGGMKQKTPESLKTVQIPRGVHEVAVNSVLALPVELSGTCMKSPVLKFRMLRLSWPEPYPMNLTTVMSLPGTAIQNYPYRFESHRDSSIQHITVPANSFFASSFKFDRQRVADEDILTPNDPNEKLTLEYFRSRSIWIELLPPGIRYDLVQRSKHYLFRDNAISMLVSLWVGAFVAVIVTPRQSGSNV